VSSFLLFHILFKQFQHSQDHAFVKKWAVLEKIGEDNKNSTAGYLQVDLTIITTSEAPAPIALMSFDDDVIERNLLLPDDSSADPENVKYLVNIFDGFFVVKRDYILQVSFGSLHVKNAKMIYFNFFFKFHELLDTDTPNQILEILQMERTIYFSGKVSEFKSNNGF
jgi:hypothetical protein